MKIATMIIMGLVAFNLVLLGGLVVVYAQANQTTYYKQFYFPLPDRYVTILESVPAVVSVDVNEFTTDLVIDSSGFSEEEIKALNHYLRKIDVYFSGLYSDNLDGVPIFTSEPLPYDCPKDTVTGVTSGKYRVDGVEYVDEGDTQGRCP